MFWKDNPSEDFNLYDESINENPYGYEDDLDQLERNDKNVLDMSKRYCKYAIFCIIETFLAIFITTLVYDLLTRLCGISGDIVYGFIIFVLWIAGYLVGLIMTIRAFSKKKWWGSLTMVVIYIIIPLLLCLFYLGFLI